MKIGVEKIKIANGRNCCSYDNDKIYRAFNN